MKGISWKMFGSKRQINTSKSSKSSKVSSQNMGFGFTKEGFSTAFQVT